MEMKRFSGFSVFLLLALFFSLPLQASGNGEFMNTITVEGQCGHENTGQLQFLQNSDKESAYKVMVRTVETRQGESIEKIEQHAIEAGGRKHLGCSLSDVAPLTGFTRTVVSEEK
jgi:hypothetical protein